MIDAVPWAGVVVPVMVLAVPRSLASTAIVVAVASVVSAVLATPIGSTFTVELALEVFPAISRIVYVNEAAPENPAVGVNCTRLPTMVAVPPELPSIDTRLSPAPTSLASTSIVTAEPAFVATGSEQAPAVNENSMSSSRFPESGDAVVVPSDSKAKRVVVWPAGTV